MPLVLTLKEAAAELTVHPESLRLMIERGEIRGVKIAGRWKVEPDELLLFIKRRRGK